MNELKLCGAVHGADPAYMIVRVTPRFDVNYQVEKQYRSAFIHLSYLYLCYLNVSNFWITTAGSRL